MRKCKAKRSAGRTGSKACRDRGRWRPELVGEPARVVRTTSLTRPGRGGSGKADGRSALEKRIGRIRRTLYDLYGDLEYFKSSPVEHREALRQKLDWPDVGHITSLTRSLAEEGRFADWLKFNRCLNGLGPVGGSAREKSA